MAENKLVPMNVFLQQPNVNKFLESVLQDRKAQFMVAMTNLANSSNQLKNCDRNSLVTCGLKAAGMNLSIDPNLGQAWAVPYGDKAQFQIGKAGWIQIAMRSGQYVNLTSRDVREGEYVGDDEFGEPIIKWLDPVTREEKKIIGYMAGMKLINGFKKIIYWPTVKVEKHAMRFSQGYQYYKRNGGSSSTSRSGNKESPWVTDFPAMAEKTLIKNLIKNWGIVSTELSSAIQADQAVIKIDYDTGEEEIEYPDNKANDATAYITKAQQEEILKNNPKEKVDKALEALGIADVFHIPADDYQAVLDELELPF